MGLFSSRRPNTTREAKEQGRRRKETAAPPTVCLSGRPYMEGESHRARCSGGSCAPTRSASSWSRASLLRTVVPSRQRAASRTRAWASSKDMPTKSRAAVIPRV